jgi:ABC-type antimicrobial peptide transport system permease subunit
MSALQIGGPNRWLVVHTEQRPELLEQPIREIIRARDPNIVLANPSTLEEIVSDQLDGFRTIATALGWLTGVALLLTSVGLYGVLAYHVSQRKGEFGIRMAIGASAPDLLRLVVRHGLRLVVVGLLLGLGGALLGTRVLERLLYETSPIDPVSFLTSSLGLGSIALLACALPAWRATRISPTEVLRRE